MHVDGMDGVVIICKKGGMNAIKHSDCIFGSLYCVLCALCYVVSTSSLLIHQPPETFCRGLVTTAAISVFTVLVRITDGKPSGRQCNFTTLGMTNVLKFRGFGLWRGDRYLMYRYGPYHNEAIAVWVLCIGLCVPSSRRVFHP